MQKLLRGIHHFQDNVFSSQRELFERLAEGQHPDTLFINRNEDLFQELHGFLPTLSVRVRRFASPSS
jgi:hypothetical protein